MIDSVLKGTGNSRFLKSAVPAGTSWADALAMLQAGTFPIDFNGINTEGFQQVGTPLNKANLLKDATAAQIGLPPSTTPDGMFRALGNTGELHVWRKTIANGTGTYSLGAVQEGLYYIKWANYATSDSSVGTFEYGSEVSVDNDGSITGIKNPSTITIEPWYDDVSKADVFKGKFIKMISQVETSMSSFKIGEIWWIPTDAIMTTGLVNGEGNTRHIATSKRQQVIGIPARTTTTYPVSTNPKAYQEGDDAKAAGYVLGDVENTTLVIAYRQNTVCNFSYSDALYVADDGSISLANPTSGTAGGSYNGAPTYLSGKFLKFVSISGNGGTTLKEGVVYYIPSNATIKIGSYAGYVDAEIDRYQPVTGYAAIPAGTTIEYLGKLGDKARVQFVSYVGTGTYGSSNPNSLTFDFVPKMVIVVSTTTNDPRPSNNGWENMLLWVTGIYRTRVSGAYVPFSQNGKTLSWHSGSNGSNYQCNVSGAKYTAIAIG